MSKFRWSAEQEKAIKARDCSLLVAAAAGSGKTAVLVERIIQRILNPNENIDIDKLVVVTFTSAAASEMRERIERAISEKINNLSEKDDPEFRKKLKRQITLLPKATITTLHSFCRGLIKANFNKIDIDPNFAIMSSIEAGILKEEVADKLLESMYEREDIDSERFEQVVDIYGGTRNDDGLKKLILDIHEFINSCPFPLQWLEEQTDKFSAEKLSKCAGDFSKTPWGEFVYNKLKEELAVLIKRASYSAELCDLGEIKAYIEEFEKYADFFTCLYDSILKEASWDELYEQIRSFEMKTYYNRSKTYDPDILAAVKETKDSFKKTIELYKDSFFACTSQENILEIEKVHYVLAGVSELVKDFSKEYQEKKRKKRLVDYGDLEHFALTILTENPEIAEELQNYYEEVYTDEYQDINLTQETILSLISRKSPKVSNLFMVGDIKQSIYGFRQARPDVFLEKYNRYLQDDMAENRLIKLFKNFRSRRDVIHSVNYIFSGIMSKELCGIDYNREEYLFYGADYEEPDWDVSCEVLLTDDKDTEDFYTDKRKIELEAAMISKKIAELTMSGKIKYKDIAVLLRATKDKASLYKEILEDYGIPAFCDITMGFYQSKEVMYIISFLEVIDNPIQDIPLLAVLKSPAGGFSESDIVNMRLIDREKDIYTLLTMSAQEDENSKAGVFLEKLSELREYAVEADLSDLILKLFRDTDCFNFAGIYPDGTQRRANLRKLYDEAVHFENQTGGGIFQFLTHVKRIRETNGDIGSATVLGENDNVVRIMSIHKSKGLEFPVVFMANMDKNFNRKEFRESLLMHQDLGFGADSFDTELRVKHETITKTVMKQKMNREMISEEIRLLYVAMTRAREKLIMTGVISELPKKLVEYKNVIASDEKKVPVHYITSAKSYFDFVMPMLVKHPDFTEFLESKDCFINENDKIHPEEDEECSFNVIVYKSDELSADIMQKEVEISSVSAPIKRESQEDFEMLGLEKYFLTEEVSQRLEYEYPFYEAVSLPVKISVSEVKSNKSKKSSDSEEAEIPVLKRPIFLDGKKPRSAAEMGTVTHYIMQNIDFDNINEEHIEELARRQGLTDKELKRFNKQRIILFFKSDLGKRLLTSGKIYREAPFTMAVPAKELYEELETTEDNILVQGIVDCYFEEDNEIVLLDYKTDHVETGKEAEAAEKYRIQLDLYAKALENETGKIVKEKIVYFLNKEKYVRF